MQQDLVMVNTKGRGFYALTGEVNQLIANSKISQGLCHLFLQHTSASLIISENADPLVQVDLENFMQRLVLDGDERYQHCLEGIDDMPAHIRAVLTSTFLAIPFQDNKLRLGIWQGVYLWEHRLEPFRRQVVVTLLS